MNKTSDELDSILTILRKYNVISFAGKRSITTKSEINDILEISVTFGPEIGEPVSNTPVTPGGWKSNAADRLDNPDKLFEYDKEPHV